MSRLTEPLSRLLMAGISPQRLAWSLAVGAVVGVNPLIGSTTLVALGVAMLLRLNIVAVQVSNHLVYPLEVLLFPLFLKLGSLLFGTSALPLAPRAMLVQAGRHPWATTRLLWTSEWHALVVWAGFACVAAPLLALGLRPVLEKLIGRMRPISAGVAAALDPDLVPRRAGDPGRVDSATNV